MTACSAELYLGDVYLVLAQRTFLVLVGLDLHLTDEVAVKHLLPVLVHLRLLPPVELDVDHR